MRVGVKFCGNCNPRVNMPELVNEMAAQTQAIQFVHWEPADYEVLLVLSACAADCATRPLFAGPVVAATSEAVERWPVAADELAAAILDILKRYLTVKTTE